ncbi:hypothetical protein ANCCAN_13441 [Ancylostoma caninum]|uniref:Glycosyltransferase family 92 protein n=1 Tax=Ancylostoma caninum TaxID=29170 RepID=A0A368G8D8_ANCCA|nr:hypothetical protein ANCCAN_13441 [Ancylostoma caninum]
MMKVTMQYFPYKAIRENSEYMLPENCRRWRNLPFVFLACGIIVGLIYGYFAQKAMPNNIALPEHIKSCVPFYELLQKHVKASTGNRKSKLTKLSLLASYAYSDYAVVTLEADGWYGHPLAYYMSISERKDEETDFMVPVLDRIDDPPPYALSVCLAPFYGNDSKWLLLAELVEHYKLQGVEHFYFYVKEVDDYSRKLINDYVKGGEAEMVRFSREHDRPLRNWQHVAVQDCVQRSRQHSRYTIFADIDERIMPLKDNRLVDYVTKTMIKDAALGMLQLKSRWIQRTSEVPTVYEGAETLLKHLPTLVFHKTLAVAPRGYTAKCILDTKRVLLMQNHKVLIYFPEYIGLVAPADEAVIWHYRYTDAGESNSSSLAKAGASGPSEMMSYPEKLGEQLFRNVQARLDYVYRDQRSNVLCTLKVFANRFEKCGNEPSKHVRNPEMRNKKEHLTYLTFASCTIGPAMPTVKTEQSKKEQCILE